MATSINIELKDLGEARETIQLHSNSMPPELQELNEKVKSVALDHHKIYVSGNAIGAAFVNADINWAIRTVAVDLPNAINANASKTGTVAEKLNYFYQAMGITTALNAILGTLGSVKNFFNILFSYEIGDKDGVVENTLSLGASLTQAIGGATYVASRPLALAALATNTTISMTSASLLGRATSFLSQAGVAVFGVFYGMLGAIGGWNLFKLIQFKYRYFRAKDKVKFLHKELRQLSRSEKKKLKSLKKHKHGQKELINEAKKMLPSVASETHFKKKDWKRLFKVIDKEELINLGYGFKIKKLEMKHEMQLKRVAGGKAVELLKKYEHIRPENLSNSKKREIIAKTNQAWNTKVVINTLLVVLGCAGVAATIAGFIFTAGIAPIIITAVWILAVIIPMLIVDGYCYYVDLKETGPGKYDKKFLIASSVIAVLAAVTAITMTCIFSFGIAPIVLTLLLTAVWLGINGFTYRCILNAEKKQKKKKKKVESNELVKTLKEWKKVDKEARLSIPKIGV